MIFSYFSSVASSGAICRKSDFTRLVNLPNVAELVKRFREGDADAKKHLPAFCFHASFRNGGHRSSADALPSGLFMVDFDHLISGGTEGGWPFHADLLAAPKERVDKANDFIEGAPIYLTGEDIMKFRFA